MLEDCRFVAAWSRLGVLAGLALIGCGFSAGGQVKAEIQRYEDWEIVCSSAGSIEVSTDALAGATEDETQCRLQQAQAVNEGHDVVFLSNTVEERGQLVAVVSVPLEVYLPAGLWLQTDGGKGQRAVFEACNLTGCHAGFALDSNLIAAMRRSTPSPVELLPQFVL